MVRLNSDTATSTEQLTAAEAELLELEEKRANNSGRGQYILDNRIAKQREVVDALKVQVQAEKDLEAEEKNRIAAMRSLAEIDTAYLEVLKEKGEQYSIEAEQASEAADRKIEAIEEEAQARKESAQQQLNDMLLLNETSLEQSFRIRKERIALIQSLREQDLINEEEYSAS
jgi:hypothetical protein